MDLDGWYVWQGVSNFGWVTGGYLNGTITSSTPVITSPYAIDVDVTNRDIIRVSGRLRDDNSLWVQGLKKVRLPRFARNEMGIYL